MASEFSRRTLIGASGMATAASYSRILGANDRVEMGLIGCGNRGTYVMSLFQKEPGVHVAALCDVYGARIESAREKAPGARGFADHRKLLESKDIDVVLVATPDHWHAEIAIDAMQAGKDVYVEKPLTYRREEGPRVVRAARTTKRICQVGLQQRSGPQFIKVRDEYVRSGKLGRVTYVRSWWHGNVPRPLNPKIKEKPADLDWARYLGQVKWRDWNPAQYFSYRAFLDFGGGKITDLFTHWIDAIHMMLDNDATLAVMTAGGVYHQYNDGRDAPDTLSLTLEYRGPVNVTFESAGLPNMGRDDIEVCGTEGRVLVNRGRLEYHSLEKGAQPVIERVPGDITAHHVRNFLECCRTRKVPNCDPYFGHRGTQVALLAVQSYVEKRRIHFDPDREIVLPA
jgi:predicted dehydrogenase